MKTSEFENIKNLIQKAEVEQAKAQGVKENIRAGWKKTYGFDTLDEAKEKLEELNSEYNKNESRKEKLMNDLSEAQNWDKIEDELEA